MSRSTHPGPHELGQNLLINIAVARRVAGLVAARPGPIVEWAAGRGALTAHLARLERPVEAVEIDPRSLRRLKRAAGPHVRITRGDILRHTLPEYPHDLVCNVPFHITTAVLRRLLGLPSWRRAVLITQWEVARKRAAVGGTTMLTAQWWPWFTFRLDQRISARSFRPIPSVDAGILQIDRRREALVAGDRRKQYQRFVAGVFNSGSPNLSRSLSGAGIGKKRSRRYLHENEIPANARPRDLDAQHWAELFAISIGN